MVTVTVTAGIKISITITPIPMGEQIPYQDLPQLQNMRRQLSLPPRAMAGSAKRENPSSYRPEN
ncbi:unnamed protein product [Fusarium graminearum]|uniref:Chromosome 1, complete genome n=1 Tax=Gibberella zeae (strain ATCC MYA-4620 / CBS 123657 / FGSC 9075 / NRRL 31084 / PH-1) TaxID=229533 RepID=A0A098D9L5_GIBZE|nr:unnamed protein product [Fusarium graminearum]CZS78902.1 unnamed protein product [Fusarium graminearum]